jgi:Uma2 family endonuclease
LNTSRESRRMFIGFREKENKLAEPMSCCYDRSSADTFDNYRRTVEERMSAHTQTYMTVEDYLTFERASDVKHEYYAGQIFALAGASEQHNLIASSVVALLYGQVRKRPCNVYPSDMRVKIQHSGIYTYPDISVVCGPAEFEDFSRDTLLNPIVIIEILSPSTESYDRGKKFQNYRTIETLQEYILIAQDAKQIEQYVRQPGNLWLLSSFSEDDETAALSSIDCVLSVADVYEKVIFDQG